MKIVIPGGTGHIGTFLSGRSWPTATRSWC
jgi:hypothetical protein